MKAGLLASVALAGIVVAAAPQAAFAQAAATNAPPTEAPPPAVGTTPPADASAAASAAQSDASTNTVATGDIIVTAQKRSEKLKEVPATLIVRNAEQLTTAGVRSPTDLSVAFPGLTYSNANASAQPAIRGITTAAASGTVENPVAVYIDGIYQPGQAMTNAYDLTNVSDVNVLKGPQGTVFGRNVVAGAVLITTKGPNLHEFSGDAQATLSLYGGGSSRNALNNAESIFLSAPLVDDHLAISLALSRTAHAGWIRNLNPTDDNGRTGRDHKYAVQGKVLWEPNSSVRLLFNARYYSEYGQTGPTTRDGVSAVLNFPDGIVGTKPWQTADDTTGFYKVRTQSYSLRADFDTDVGTFTSLTAYQKETNPQSADTDGGYSPACHAAFACIDLGYNFALPEIVSQEVDFASKKFGPISFVTGVFAFSKKSDLPVYINRTIFLVEEKSLARSFAGFGEATLDIADNLSAIAGIRYTYDAEKQKGTNVRSLPFSDPQHIDGTAVTKRFSLKYRPVEELNLYATYSEGYQSGFITTSQFNTAAGVYLPPIDPVKPQRLTSYEAGAKLNIANTSLNLSAFHYKYSDIVVQRFTGTTNEFANAARAKVDGIDADWNVQLAQGLHLTGGISWLPTSKFTSFPSAPVYVISGHTATPVARDLSGARMIRSPKITASAALDYDWLFSSGKVHLNGSFYHTSRYQTQLGGTNDQRAYNTIGALASYTPEGSNLSFTVFGRNLTNKAYVTGTVPSAAGFLDYFAPPREIGGTVAYHF